MPPVKEITNLDELLATPGEAPTPAVPHPSQTPAVRPQIPSVGQQPRKTPVVKNITNLDEFLTQDNLALQSLLPSDSGPGYISKATHAVGGALKTGFENALDIFGVGPKADRKRTLAAKRQAYDALIQEVSQEEGVNPELIHALVTQESGYDPKAQSKAGAQGLTQLMPGTAQLMGVKNPFDPKENLSGGVRYLKGLFAYFKGNLPLALAAYNAGPGNVEAAGNAIPKIPETENFVKSILGNLGNEDFFHPGVLHARRPTKPQVNALIPPPPPGERLQEVPLTPPTTLGLRPGVPSGGFVPFPQMENEPRGGFKLPSGVPTRGFIGPQPPDAEGHADNALLATVTDPDLNGGRPTNIPLLVPGQDNIEALRQGKGFSKAQQDIAVRNAIFRQERGETIPSYKTMEEAQNALRSENAVRGLMESRARLTREIARDATEGNALIAPPVSPRRERQEALHDLAQGAGPFLAPGVEQLGRLTEQLGGLATAARRGLADIPRGLANIPMMARKLSESPLGAALEKLGIPRGGESTRRFEDALHRVSRTIDPGRPLEEQNIEEKIIESLGQSIPGLAEAMAYSAVFGPTTGLALSGLIRHADQGPLVATLEAVKQGLFGRTLVEIGKLPLHPAAAAGIGGGFFGGLTLAETGDPYAALTQFFIGAGLGYVGRLRSRASAREMAEGTEYDKGPAKGATPEETAAHFERWWESYAKARMRNATAEQQNEAKQRWQRYWSEDEATRRERESQEEEARRGTRRVTPFTDAQQRAFLRFIRKVHPDFAPKNLSGDDLHYELGRRDLFTGEADKARKAGDFARLQEIEAAWDRGDITPPGVTPFTRTPPPPRAEAPTGAPTPPGPPATSPTEVARPTVETPARPPQPAETPAASPLPGTTQTGSAAPPVAPQEAQRTPLSLLPSIQQQIHEAAQQLPERFSARAFARQMNMGMSQSKILLQSLIERGMVARDGSAYRFMMQQGQQGVGDSSTRRAPIQLPEPPSSQAYTPPSAEGILPGRQIPLVRPTWEEAARLPAVVERWIGQVPGQPFNEVAQGIQTFIDRIDQYANELPTADSQETRQTLHRLQAVREALEAEKAAIEDEQARGHGEEPVGDLLNYYRDNVRQGIFKSPPAPATFLGWQETLPGEPPIALWNLTEDIPGHNVGSTVVSDTLRDAGFEVKEPERPAVNPGVIPTEAPTTPGQEFEVGSRVQYESRGEPVTGTIVSLGSDGEAEIEVDQQVNIHGRIPIGRIEYVHIDELQPLVSDTPPDVTPSVAPPSSLAQAIQPILRRDLGEQPFLAEMAEEITEAINYHRRTVHWGDGNKNATLLMRRDIQQVLLSPKYYAQAEQALGKNYRSILDSIVDIPEVMQPLTAKAGEGAITPQFNIGDRVAFRDGSGSGVITERKGTGTVIDPYLYSIELPPISPEGQARRVIQINEQRLRAVEQETPPSRTPEREPTPSTTPFLDTVQAIYERIRQGNIPGTLRELQQIADQTYGSNRASGAYTPRDLYDAVETAIVRFVGENAAHFDPRQPLANALLTLKDLQDLLDKLPTQTVRTEDQLAYQQFSTPITYAYAAAWATNPSSGPALEPSAGTGSLAVFLKNALGQEQVYVNEIDPRRLEALRGNGFTHVTAEDALYLDSILRGKIPTPAVVLMNPPFSSAGRQNRKEQMIGPKHVEQALRLLQPGGRLVAIVGHSMGPDVSSFRHWFDSLRPGYTLHAAIRIEDAPRQGRAPAHSAVYAKYGTNFATRVLIFEKTPQGDAPTLLASVKTLPELMHLIEGSGVRYVHRGPQPGSMESTSPDTKPGTIGPESPPPGDVVGTGASGRLPETPGDSERGAGAGPTGDVDRPGNLPVDVSASPGRPGSAGGGRLPERERPAGPLSGGDVGDSSRPPVRPDRQPSGGGPGGLVEQFANLSEEEFDRLFDEALATPEGETPEPAPREPKSSSPAPTPPLEGGAGRTPTPLEQRAQESGLSATPDELEAIRRALEGIKEDPDPYGPWLLGVDPQTYRAIEPHLQAILARMVDEGKGILDFFRAITNTFGQEIRPYVNQFRANMAREQQKPETPTAKDTQVPIESATPEANVAELTDALFEEYTPQRLRVPGAHPHRDPLVQSAALSSVIPPEVTYQPALPPEIITEGRISLPQLEAVVAAGQAHGKILPAPENAPQIRRGFFVGDSPGTGKGRIIAATIADNVYQGRRKAVWISKNDGELFNAAQKDWVDVTKRKPEEFFRLGKFNINNPITLKEGILFTSYDTLRVVDEKDKTKTRVAQIAQWLGPGFDGVIAFDESHLMGNNTTTGKGFDKKEASKRAMAGIALQEALPNARILYASATGATEVSNLGYLLRLGLWGYATPFPTKADFIDEVGSRGLSAMEWVARDLKAMGSYIARSLSYREVTYSRLEHQLTEQQRIVYDKMAEAWQIVLRNVDKALELNNAFGKAKMAARGRFWGQHLAFFNQLIIAMQTPAMIADIDRHIADPNGDAIIIQLVNTNEEIQKRRLAAMEEGDTLEDVSLSPVDILMGYVRNSFPVQQMETYIDQDGNEKTRPLLDSENKPVLNPESVAMRDALLTDLAILANDLPDGPLEMILDHFGPENVAEITGRHERLVRVQGEDGRTQRIRQKLTNSSVKRDLEDFRQDKKRILMFSGKGDTGMSYHADLTTKNQRHRQHYALQTGWRADSTIQALGRSHRTNQKSAPNIQLVTTDIPGQKRFFSTIARRLDQLGALSHGQRQASAQGLFAERDNLESVYANDALRQYYDDILTGRHVSFTADEFTQQTGINLASGSRPPIHTFLNRLLSMSLGMQERVLEELFLRIDQKIEIAIEQGIFDIGTETLRADRITKAHEDVIASSPEYGETKHVTLRIEHKRTPLAFDRLQDRLALLKKRGESVGIGSHLGYVQNKQSERHYAIVTNISKISAGNVVEQVRRVGTDGEDTVPRSDVDSERYAKISPVDIEQRWADEIAGLSEYRSHETHILTGTLLPYWDRVPNYNIRVVRAQAENGERFFGFVVAPKDIAKVLRRFGKQPIGAGQTAEDFSPRTVMGKIYENASYEMSNGWILERSRVGGQLRVELRGPRSEHVPDLRRDGVIVEIIGSKPRYFLPTGEPGIALLTRMSVHNPVVARFAGDTENVEEEATTYDRFPGNQEGGGTVEEPPAGYHPSFAQSQVVDTEGKLKPVYHGTAHMFDSFDPERKGSAAGQMYDGFFFAEDAVVAERYAEKAIGRVMPFEVDERLRYFKEEIARVEQLIAREQRRADGGDANILGSLHDDLERFHGLLSETEAFQEQGANIRPVYLNITYPFDLTQKPDMSEVKQIVSAVNRRTPGQLPNGLSTYGKFWSPIDFLASLPTNRDVMQFIVQHGYDQRTFARVLQDVGYDGIFHIGNQDGRVWVAFAPEQIRPVFDPETKFFEPEPFYDERSDATPATRQLATDALDTLERIATSDVSTARRGVVSRQRDLPGEPGRARARELFRRLPSDDYIDALRKDGHAVFVGQRVETPHDIAVLAQAVRDPRVEHLHWVFTRGETVIAVDAISSRLPASSAAFLPVRTGEDNSPAALERSVRHRMRGMGADGYYLVHNHPSGDPEPSSADNRMTVRMDRNIPGFKGHVVIDHGRYAVIDVTDGVAAVSRHDLPISTTPDPLIPTLAESHSIAVRTPEDLARLARQFPEQGVVAFFLDQKHKIRSAQVIPDTVFATPEVFQRYLQDQKPIHGAGRVVVSLNNLRAPFILGDIAKDYVNDGTILDYVQDATGNLSQSTAPRSMPSMDRGVVREEETPFSLPPPPSSIPPAERLLPEQIQSDLEALGSDASPLQPLARAFASQFGRGSIIRGQSGAVPIPAMARAAVEWFLDSVWSPMLQATQPELFKLFDQEPELYKFAVRALAARDAAMLTARQRHDALLRLLNNDDDKMFLLIKALLADHRAALEADPKRAAGVAGGSLPTLTIAELRKFHHGPDEDLELIKAMNYYKSTIQPEIEFYATAAGVTTRLVGPIFGTYIHTIALDHHAKTVPPGVIWGPTGPFVAWGKAPKGTTVGSPGRTTGGIPFSLSRKRARAAIRASGSGQHYLGDPLGLLTGMYDDRFGAAFKNLFVQKVASYDIPPHPKTGRFPETVMFAGKTVPVVRSSVGVKSAYHLEQMRVPKPVEDAWKLMVDKDVPEWIEVLNKANNVFVTMAILSPAEAVQHAANVVGALWGMPRAGGSLGPLGRIMGFAGPLRYAAIMADILTLHGDSFEKDLRTIAEYGGLRTRMFGEIGEQPWLPTTGKIGKIAAPFEAARTALKHAIFDYPGTARGLWGLESRIRVAFFRSIKAMHPGIDVADAVRKMNDAFGTYVPQLQPPLVKALKNFPMFNAFAAASVSLSKTAAKAVIGRGADGFHWETLIATWLISTLVSETLNAWLDPKERDPWNIPGKKLLDIRVHTDGRIVDIPGRTLMPGPARAFRVTGLREIIPQVLKGNWDTREFANIVMFQAVNNVLEQFGMLPRTVIAGASGYSTYLLRNGSLLSTEPPATRKMHILTAIKDRMLTMGRAMVPMGGTVEAISSELLSMIPGVTDPDALPAPEAIGHGWTKALWYAVESLGIRGAVRPSEDVMATAELRGEKAQDFRVARSIASRASRFVGDPAEMDEFELAQRQDQADAFIEREIARNWPDDQNTQTRMKGVIARMRMQSIGSVNRAKNALEPIER